MDWCPVEWPPRPHPGSVAVRKKQSGRKAALAGLTGLLVLVLMVGAVLGYALWSKRLGGLSTTRVASFVQNMVSSEIPVKLSVKGQSMLIRTRGKTVQDVLKEQGIRIQPGDEVIPAPSTALNRDMEIRVVRVELKTELQEVAIPFASRQVANPELPKGVRLVKEGQEGLERQTWQVRYEDGIETSRTCLSREVIQEPAEGLVQYGTMGSISRGGEVLRFSRVMDMFATGYSYTGSNTASGEFPGPGVAAVDPNVIPLGTRLYIEGYGKAVALDTGGSIIGNRIDLFYETDEQAVNWGGSLTRVYILE